MIYIYDDEGTSAESLMHTLYTFERLLGHRYLLKTINATEIKEGQWKKKAKILILPGGADLPYVRRLNGIGNEQIKEYVANGGSFLGICAGSYYASSYVEFDKNGPLEVLGERELKLFPGKVIGPVLAPYNPYAPIGARSAKILLTSPFAHPIFTYPTSSLNLYYNGGGFFENAEQFPDTQVLAYYDNQLPAIISNQYQKGCAILSALHFEYDPLKMKAHNNLHTQNIIHCLYENNVKRELLILEILKILKIEL